MEKQVKFYKRILITPGPADYKDCNDGVLLILKPAIDNALNTIKGKPVVITHDSKEPVGEVVDAYFDANSGSFICGFNIFTDDAKQLIDNNGYGVSPEYNIIKSNDNGGTYHNMEYKQEAIEIEFVNLAIVEHPRYEECKKVVNSIINNNKEDMSLFKKVKNEVEVDKKENEVSTENKKNSIVLSIDGREVDLGQFLQEEKAEGHDAIKENEAEVPVEEKKEEAPVEEKDNNISLNDIFGLLSMIAEKVGVSIENSCEEKKEEVKENGVEENQEKTSTKEMEEKIDNSKKNEVVKNEVNEEEKKEDKPVQNAIKKVMNSVIEKVAFKTRAERIDEVSNSFYIK